VWLHEDKVVPRILGAFEGACFVVKSEVSNDPRACWIGGANVVVAAEKSMRLIKVGGLGHIGGDNCVIAAFSARQSWTPSRRTSVHLYTVLRLVWAEIVRYTIGERTARIHTFF